MESPWSYKLIACWSCCHVAMSAGRDQHWIHHLGCPGPAGGGFHAGNGHGGHGSNFCRSNDEKLVDTPGEVRFVGWNMLDLQFSWALRQSIIVRGLAAKQCQEMKWDEDDQWKWDKPCQAMSSHVNPNNPHSWRIYINQGFVFRFLNG